MNDHIKILYVDDEPDIRTIVELALGLDPGLDVRLAESGPAALAMLTGTGWRPDLALLDMMMPEMLGSELLAHLRTLPELASVPALFVTASARSSDIEDYIALGASGVITKPFDPMSLAQVVRGYYTQLTISGQGT